MSAWFFAQRPVGWAKGAGHRRGHPGTDRSGAGDRQPFFGQAGLCPGAGRFRFGGGGHADQRPGNLTAPVGAQRIDVLTAQEMHDAVLAASAGG